MYQRILVGVDLSEGSLQALDEARALAQSTGASLGVVHVMPDYAELAALHASGYLGTLPAMTELLEEARERIRFWASNSQPDTRLEVFLEQGTAVPKIVDCAEHWGADLLVVGGGESGSKNPSLGSVARRIVHSAHCPVLVSRSSSRSGVILAATDLSDPSLPAISRAAAEAHRRGSRLTVVHVVDPSAALYAASAGGFFGLTVALPPPELRLEVKESLTQTMKQALQRLGATGEALVLYGSPAESIVQCARELAASLIVVGTHGRTGLLRVAVGSVADSIARLAPCSVLVARHARSA